MQYPLTSLGIPGEDVLLYYTSVLGTVYLAYIANASYHFIESGIFVYPYIEGVKF